MKKRKLYYVYIMASVSRVLYIGVTGSLVERVGQHKQGTHGSEFTKKYRASRLVYFERYSTIYDAIEREKQIKKWRREKKLKLIEKVNADWTDLSLEWIYR